VHVAGCVDAGKTARRVSVSPFDTVRAVNSYIRSLVLLALLPAPVLSACSSAVDRDVPTPSNPTSTTQIPTTTTTTTTTSTTTTTTTTTTTSTTTPAPPPSAPAPIDPALVAPVWPPYEPLPGVDGVAALTNLPADPATTTRPVLAVKIDNHPSARPHWQLDAADVIVEQLVEGGMTRFIALYHSRIPGAVGPVRSARTTDLPFLGAANRPVFAWSGGNPYVVASVSNADAAGLLVNRGAGRIWRCYRREPSRRIPHNLVADPSCLLASAPTAGPARPLWEFGPVDEERGVEAPSFTLRIGAVSVGWDLDASGRYLRTQNDTSHVAASGTRISADNVIVITVAYKPSPADARSPEADTVGTGTVVVHRQGRSYAGTWYRAHHTDPFTFKFDDGTAILLTSGTSFVELVAR
jgi:hypothetical protein